MKSTQIWDFARSLSPEEQRRFKKYLCSPYFNADERLVKLWDWLLKAQQSGVGDKAEAFSVIFPTETFQDAKMRHHCSYLLRHLLDFVGIEQLKQKPFEQQLLTLEGLERPGLEKFFHRTERKLSSYMDKPGRRDQGHFLQALRLSFRLTAKVQAKMSRSQDQLLVESDRQLDLFYTLSKLRSACSFINNQQVLKGMDGGIDIQVLNDNPDQGLALQVDIEGNPGLPIAIQVYFDVYQSLIQSDNEGHYQTLKQRLPEVSQVFSPSELRTLYTFAQNYCIRKINAGKQHYLSELFELYQEMIQSHLILENGTLSPWHYKNITVTALRLGKFDWVEAFLEQNRSKIPTKYRENAFTYNSAKLNFYRKEYSEVLRLLQKVEYEDLFYNLDSKAMILKTYYESREWDALESMMESFAQYLRRNRTVPEKHKKNYLNLIRFVKKMSGIPSSEVLQKLKKDLESSQNVADKDWILQMLEK